MCSRADFWIERSDKTDTPIGLRTVYICSTVVNDAQTEPLVALYITQEHPILLKHAFHALFCTNNARTLRIGLAPAA